MVKILRLLLIACAVAAPLVAGMPASIAASSSVALRPTGPSPFDDHREDDAGTAVEQAEEDDTEEKVFRDLLLTTESAAVRAADQLRQQAGSPASLSATVSCRRGHSSRGPPA
ncbi:MAG: hypothetical protein ACKO40_11205 [Planctomycetaceae bacterium]